MLRLHTLDTTYQYFPTKRLSPLCRPEALRRLAWAVYVLDTISDAGKYGAHTITDDVFDIQLPADEADFVRDIQAHTVPLVPLSYDEVNVSLSAHLIRVCQMRRRILHFAARLKPGTNDWTELGVIETDLNRLVGSLPQHLGYSEHQYFAMADRMVAFAHFHCLRHNCYIILNRAKLLVAGLVPDLASKCVDYRRARVQRAIPVSRIIGDAMRHGVRLEKSVGIQAYVALESELGLGSADRSLDL